MAPQRVWINAREPEERTVVDEEDKLRRFEECIIPHMDAAYNLACWLVGNPEDARDLVQDAYLRAFKFFEGFRGVNSRSWLLRIVRNVFYDFVRRQRQEPMQLPENAERMADPAPGPDAALLQKADGELVRRAIEALPVRYREVLVMRELEDCSYREIAEIADVPVGTVMSRLARAREMVRRFLAEQLQAK